MSALLVQAPVWLFAVALAATTLLPLSPSRRWWVRIWDFPRLHIALGFGLLAPVALVALPWPAGPVVAGLSALGLAYQLAWMLPYTPLAAPEARVAPDDPDAVTLLAANVLQENRRHDLVLRLIEETDPDVVLLMEMDAAWDAALAPALARYDTVLREIRDDYYGMIFATRLRVASAAMLRLTHDATPTALAELATRAGRPFVFLGLHPQPPTPDGADTDERDAQIIYAARFARSEDRPLVAMGDFNEAAWSKGAKDFKRVGGYVDPRVGRGLFASIDARHFMIRCPIDQLYVTEEVAVVSVRLGPKIGSDHFPMIARLRFEPELGRRLNTPPPPLPLAEVERLDEIVAAYRRRLDAAAVAAEAEGEVGAGTGAAAARSG
jgi:endonuclease/exonuclease/phosphatase (EEP) superfamily protein YafD